MGASPGRFLSILLVSPPLSLSLSLLLQGAQYSSLYHFLSLFRSCAAKARNQESKKKKAKTPRLLLQPDQLGWPHFSIPLPLSCSLLAAFPHSSALLCASRLPRRPPPSPSVSKKKQGARSFVLFSPLSSPLTSCAFRPDAGNSCAPPAAPWLLLPALSTRPGALASALLSSALCASLSSSALL